MLGDQPPDEFEDWGEYKKAIQNKTTIMKEDVFLNFVREKLGSPYFTFENYNFWDEKDVGRV